VDMYTVPLMPGQIFLTCSDGLTGMVDDRKIAQLITSHMQDFDALPRILIAEANRNGGKDNVTVLLSQVRDS
jgi:PPM family protein phosphatase